MIFSNFIVDIIFLMEILSISSFFSLLLDFITFSYIFISFSLLGSLSIRSDENCIIVTKRRRSPLRM